MTKKVFDAKEWGAAICSHVPDLLERDGQILHLAELLA
jgi:uncharacterized protein (UPF0276 family)